MIETRSLREARKARLAAQKVKTPIAAGFNYNPIYQKPTHVGSDQPRGGYHYFGPPPDAGTSYGFYKSPSGIGVIAPINEKKTVFDPITGSQAELEGPADAPALDAVKECQLTDFPMAPCTACGYKGMSSMAANTATAVFCPNCGAEQPAPVATEAPPAPAAEPAPAPETPDAPAQEPTMPQPTPAMHFEALSSLDKLGTVTAKDVSMNLYEDGPNSFWNIEVQAMPIGRIYLKDQPKPEEARAVFCSDQYASALANAMARLGVQPVLQQVSAKLWANAIDENVKIVELKTQAEAKAKADHDAKVKEWRLGMLDAIALVCAGMDKNFFKDEGNPLKFELYAAFRKYGIPHDRITAAIEEGFANGATQYFASVLSKAEEFTKMDPTAVDQIKKAIGMANVIVEAGAEEVPSGDVDPDQQQTLAARLVEANVDVSSLNEAALSGSQGFGQMKDAMKSTLRLGGATKR